MGRIVETSKENVTEMNSDVVMEGEIITTNKDMSKSAYEASQQALAKLIEALWSEASKIEGLGDDFGEMDEELSMLVRLCSE